MYHNGIFDLLMTNRAWFDPDMIASEWGLGGEGSPPVGALVPHSGIGLSFGF